MERLTLAEKIEHLFAGGVQAETSLGIAARLGVDEDTALVELVEMVVSGTLTLIEEGNLLIFVTPARSLELAA